VVKRRDEAMEERQIIIETPMHSFKNFCEAREWAKENIVGNYSFEVVQIKTPATTNELPR